LSFYEGVGVGVLKIEESESEIKVLKIEELESEAELLCTDSRALYITVHLVTLLYYLIKEVTHLHETYILIHQICMMK
jgi:hypothetical protein